LGKIAPSLSFTRNSGLNSLKNTCDRQNDRARIPFGNDNPMLPSRLVCMWEEEGEALFDFSELADLVTWLKNDREI
jgi:hypothetical protein